MSSRLLRRFGHRLAWVVPLVALLALPALAGAEEAAAPPPLPNSGDIVKPADGQFIANTVWTLIAGMLVFWMNAGFATLEAGLCRRKNAVNILAKNFSLPNPRPSRPNP